MYDKETGGGNRTNKILMKIHLSVVIWKRKKEGFFQSFLEIEPNICSFVAIINQLITF